MSIRKSTLAYKFSSILGTQKPFTKNYRPVKWCLGYLLAVSIIACSSSKEPADHSLPTDAEPAPQTLRMVQGSPQTLDPHLMTGSVAYNVLAAVSEPLLTKDYKTLEITPGVAERWQVSEDGLVYQFFLREQASWSNGDPVIAKHFVDGFKRILSPVLGNQYATEYYAIQGAEQYHTGKTKDFSTVGIVALSATVLQVTLSRPDPIFLTKLTTSNTAPIHSQSVLKLGSLDDPMNPWSSPGNFVSNGPFVLEEWQLNKRIVVSKNPHYWDSVAIKLDRIEFWLADSEAVGERMYRSGKVDLVFQSRIPTEKLAHYRKTAPDELVTVTAYATYFYLFNTTKKPFSDARVRKALSLAVDRQMIIDGVLKNSEKPALALSLPTDSYSPPQMENFNPVKARKLLTEAGFPGGEGFPTFTLVYNTADVHRKIAIAIQQMWKKELGLDIQLENQEWKVFLDSRARQAFDVARAGSFSTLLDPYDFLQSFTTHSGMNDSAWSNVEYDRLISVASMETVQEKRLALLQQAESILVQELPLMPIFYYRLSYLISPKVKGFEFNMVGTPIFKGVYLDSTPSNNR